MKSIINDRYPRQQLLLFVAQDVSAEIRDVLKMFVDNMADARSWQISAPRFIDEIDHAETRDEDFPDETVGCVLEIYSARGGVLPEYLDAEALAEVEFLIRAAQEISCAYSLEFELELDGVFVGAIEDGCLDKSLEKGLLNEWRVHLAGKQL